MAERKQIDWEAIEREYRAGQLSLREIASQYNISHPLIFRKAKLQGWKRDLVKRIRERVTNKLLTEDVTVNNAREEDIIDKASSRAIEIIKLHRSDAKQQQDIIRRLMDLLNERVANPEAPTLEDVRASGSVMRDCSQAFHKLVAIERQSYGIDTDGRRPDPIDEIKITVVPSKVAA